MATLLDKVVENLAWRTEQVTTTCTLVEQGFTRYDSTKHGKWPPSERQASGWMRVVRVRWAGSGPDIEATDGFQREADHTFQAIVCYPVVLPEDEMWRLVLLDRHDLIKQWRNASKVVGYDDDHTTTALGVNPERIRLSDEIDDSNPAFWLMTYTIQERVVEVEAEQ
jgi:hypothetical protein